MLSSVEVEVSLSEEDEAYLLAGVSVSLSEEDEAYLLAGVSVSLSVEDGASEWEDQADENQALEEELAKCTI